MEHYALVPTDQHDRDLLPRSQQLEPETVSDGDQAVIALGVESVTFLVRVNIVRREK